MSLNEDLEEIILLTWKGGAEVITFKCVAQKTLSVSEAIKHTFWWTQLI